MTRLLNVIDVEATCWEGPPPPGQVNEIIEIGVCVVDLDARERVGRDRIMVRPARSTVSAFCTRLTGITPAEAAGGLSFADACARLRTEHHSDSRPWASWGDYDRKQFERQCGGPVRYPFGSRHYNAKALFAEARDERRQGMAGALQAAGLPLEGRHHNGADDAWNIAALVLHLVTRDRWPSYGV
ncbi:exonuclease domain-containing protein [Dactylosporangium vinaceum]|uniref:Exonuclease domain-containing protein n=1 Tax=Dactylosporangium vinaceum TaxID=53362 RepID=A0ABV5LYD2_9ACTN|nr:3'-5' exonuclease [Dactylosporangium vinaceum]UAB95813.1 exonuclease domain-containing protein [Dactylosporangium vinaceum]